MVLASFFRYVHICLESSNINTYIYYSYLENTLEWPVHLVLGVTNEKRTTINGLRWIDESMICWPYAASDGAEKVNRKSEEIYGWENLERRIMLF